MPRTPLWIILVAGLCATGCGSPTDANSRAVGEAILTVKGTFTPYDPDLAVKVAEKIPAGSFGIRAVNLSGCVLTIPLLESFKGLSHLQELNLENTNINNAGLAYLQDLKELRVLNLYGTNIADAGMTSLLPLKNLTNLELSYTDITDKGLETLTVLPNLQTLKLYGTSVTAEGLQKFRAARPKCTVSK